MKPRRTLTLAPPVPSAPVVRRSWTRPAPSVARVAPPARDPAEAARQARLMTMAELADYVRYTGPHPARAAYVFAKRHGIRLMKRGNSTLVRVGDVDRYLETGQSTLDERAQAGKR